MAISPSALFDSALVPGHALTWLFDPVSSWQLLLQDIAEAQSRIDIQLYMLTPDLFGQQFADALVAARSRGVAVRMLLDGVGSASTTMGLLDQLLSAGVELRVFGPVRLSVPWRRWLRRNHRKVLVMDGLVAHVTGRNVGGHYYDTDPQQSGPATWIDAGVRVCGPVVAELSTHLQRDWLARRTQTEPLRLHRPLRHEVQAEQRGDSAKGAARATTRAALRQARQLLWHLWAARGGTPLAKAERRSSYVAPAEPAMCLRQLPALPMPGSRVWVAWNLGKSRTAYVNLAYIKAIRQARHDIWLAQSYFVPDVQLRQALVAAGRRGVQIHLLLPDPAVSDIPLAALASQHILGELLTVGARVWYVQNRMLHAKLGVVDGVWWTVGSANLDPLSRQRNLEANLVGRGQAEAATLIAAVQRWQEEAHQVTLQGWTNRPLLSKLSETVLWSLRGLYRTLG